LCALCVPVQLYEIMMMMMMNALAKCYVDKEQQRSAMSESVAA